MKVIKGQKVWVVERSGRFRYDPVEFIISKVGKKYFYIEVYGRSVKFDAETGKHISGFVSRYEVYESLQEIEEEKTYNTLTNKVRDFFKGWGNLPLSLDQLKEIDKIISHDNK